MSMNSKRRAWRASVRAANAVYEEGGFAVCANPVTAPDPDRPLLIIIHPGDAIEDGFGFGCSEQAQQVIQYGRENTLGMAPEITGKLQDHDVVVLHRLSSVDTIMRPDFGMSAVEAAILPYQKACLLASDVGTVLYGDDLDNCAKWLVRNMDVTRRPHIFMTGAYSTAEVGCITAVGAALVKAGCRSLTVSEYAPPDNCGDAPRWDADEAIALASRNKSANRP